jgi:hypothetical protein
MTWRVRKDHQRSPFVRSAQPAQQRIGMAFIEGKPVSVWYAIVLPRRWRGLLIYPAIAVDAAFMTKYAKPASNGTWK